METVTDFIFLGFKITVDSDYSHEIKRCLLLGRKAMTNLDSIWKNRHHFANKGPYSQSYGFSSSHIWMGELDHKEGWGLKSWFFWTVVLGGDSCYSKEIKLVKRKSTLNILWKDQCWSWSSNTLATWCEEPTHWGRPWCWETLRAGEGGDRGWDGWMASLTQRTWVWAPSGSWWWTGKLGVLQSSCKESDTTDLVTEQQQLVRWLSCLGSLGCVSKN